MIYAELWRRDMNDKYATEFDKQQAARLKNQARNAVLDTQYQDLLKRKELEKQRVLQEKQMLREKWSDDAQRRYNEEVLDREMNKQLNNQIFQDNLI